MDVLCPLESDSFSLSLPLTFPLSLINSAGFKVTFVEECRCVWPSAFVQSSKRWFNTADSRSIDPLCIAQTVFHRAIWDSVAFFMKFLYGFLPCQGWVEKFSPDYCCTNEEIVFFFRTFGLVVSTYSWTNGAVVLMQALQDWIWLAFPDTVLALFSYSFPACIIYKDGKKVLVW